MDLQKFFPYPSFNPGQKEVIERAITSFEGGARNVIIEAPTGTGKTGIAITVARYFSQINNKAHLITSQKELQRAYLKDAREIKLMMGSNNYTCEDYGVSCSDKKAMFGRMCDPEMCSYKTSMEIAKAAKITLHNFDSFLYQASIASLFDPRKLMCIDEAHDTEEHLVKAMAVKIPRDMITTLGIKWSIPQEDGIVEWMQEIQQALAKANTRLGDDMGRIQGQRAHQGVFKQMRSIGRKMQDIERLGVNMDRYLRACKRMDWVVEMSDDGVVLEPVRGSRFAGSALLKFGEYRMFLSATIFNDGKPLIRALGLREDETEYIGINKSFPVKTRPLKALDIGNLGFRTYDKNSDKVLESIRKIIDDHAGVRGVIHCTSYKIAGEIRDNIKSNRLVFHESRNRNLVISEYLAGKYPADSVLVAVSVTQGYDFKHDLCRFQVLIKVPYPFPSKRIEKRREKDPGFYDWRTCLTLVQTVGRGNRAADDHCVTYMLDSRFTKLVRTKKKMLPTWFVEAIQYKKKKKEEDDFFI